MSYLTSIVEPSGTVTVGQTVTYSFSFGGPYPVNWSFDGLGHHEYNSAISDGVIRINLAVPSNPNSYPGFISFHGPGDDPLNHVYYLSPLEGFPVVVRAGFQHIVSGYYQDYEYPIIVPDGTSQQLNIIVATEHQSFTNSTFPLTVSVTSQQIYPSLGTETTVYTHTFPTKNDYTDSTYNTPNVMAGAIYQYKAFTTLPGGSPVFSETGNSSIAVVSQAEKPWITLQPYNITFTDITLPHDGFIAEDVYLGYVSYSAATVSWHRNGVQIPLYDGIHYPSHDGSVLKLAMPNAWPGIMSTCANGDSYYCTITNAYGTTTSDTVTLTMGALVSTDAVTAQISPSTPVVMPEGGTLLLNVTSMANKPPVTYQWKKDGTPIPGATASTYLVVNAPSSASGAYTVVATSGTAVYETPSTLVTVKQHTSSSISTPNTSILWQALGTTKGMPGDSFTYSWQFDDGETKLGNPVSKTSSALSIMGTVTAIDTVTGGTATASKMVTITSNSDASYPLSDWVNAALVLPGAGDELIVFPALGTNQDNTPQTGIYSYNTLTGVITLRATLASATSSGAIGCKLSDGRIFWGGCFYDQVAAKKFFLFDPVGYTNTQVASPPSGYSWGASDTWRADPAMVQMGDGRIILPGAKRQDNGLSLQNGDAKAHIYDPVNNTWSFAPDLPINTFGGSGRVVYDPTTGYVFFHIGATASNAYTGAIYKWKVGDASWTLHATLPTALGYASVCNAGSYMFFAGGEKNTGSTNLAYLVKFSDGSITTLPVLPANGTSTLYVEMVPVVKGNRVILLGGRSDTLGATDSVFVYDLTTLSVTLLHLPKVIRSHGAQVGSDGYIHVIGGNGNANPIDVSYKTPMKMFVG